MAVLHAAAQHGNFKRPLTRTDTLFLKKTAGECFQFNPALRFSYNHDDFREEKPEKGDLPTSMANLEALKQALAKDSTNAERYTDLSAMCGRLGLDVEAREYRRKAFETISAALSVKPDSAQALVSLGSIFLSALQTDSALRYYRKAIQLEPLNKDANRLIPFLHILNNRFDSAYAFLNKQVRTHPDSYEVHEALPVYYIYKFYDQLGKYSRQKHVAEENLRPENIITLKLLKDYADRAPDDPRRTALYRVTFQVCLSTLITYKSVNDSLYDPRQIRFANTLKDAELLKQQEAFFKGQLKSKTPRNKYLANKALGNICLLSNRPQDAIPYIQKAIRLKPLKYSTVGNNASEDYNNLITAYFLLKDTSAYEKVILEKLRDRPALDSSASDYVMAGKVSLSRNHLEKAEGMFRQALALDPKQSDAWLGLALISFERNDATGALAHINEAFAQDADKWELYVLYGIVSLCNRDPVNAFEAFKEGLKRHNSSWIKTDLMEKYFDLF